MVQCTVYSLQWTMYSVLLKVYSKQFKVYILHCTLHKPKKYGEMHFQREFLRDGQSDAVIHPSCIT